MILKRIYAIVHSVLGKLLFFICFFLFIIFINYIGNETRHYVENIQMAYKGRVIKKFIRRATVVIIQINQKEKVEVGMVSQELWDNVAVGDSIEKIANENYCILNKNGIRKQMLYIYIPDNIREDRRWPSAWRSKWKE